MSDQTRRTFLKLGSVAAVGLAGCYAQSYQNGDGEALLGAGGGSGAGYGTTDYSTSGYGAPE